MQELRLVTDGSDPSSLLLRPADTDGTDGTDGDTTPAAEFWLPVTDELRDLLGVRPAAGTATDGTADGAASATDPAGTATPVAQPAADAVPAGGTGKDARHFASGRRHVDQQRSPRLRLSPKDIQGRIRHGESVADIVGDTGMDPSRVEPYAHPILLERERIATLAHDAHPVRSDGPAEHTLWEVLATALAARGDSVRDAEWDAHQDFSGQWVVTVAWGRGGSALEAEFTYEPQRQGPSTAVPRNSVATDIIDPRFERPVRSVAAVTPCPATARRRSTATTRSSTTRRAARAPPTRRAARTSRTPRTRTPTRTRTPVPTTRTGCSGTRTGTRTRARTAVAARPSPRTGRTCCSV